MPTTTMPTTTMLTQTKCGHCGVAINPYSQQNLKFAGDSQVCSDVCQEIRMTQIEAVDPTMEFPNQWNERLNERITARNRQNSDDVITRCGFCTKPVATLKCTRRITVYYCSIECQRNHWVSGDTDVCWRPKRNGGSTTLTQSSIIVHLKRISDKIMCCTGW